MKSNSNYLMEFLQKVDILISEINKLESKIRLYQRNSETFEIKYEVKFEVSPEWFVKLRNFLQKKIENGSCYDRDIVNLKREFSKSFPYIMAKIQKELLRIDYIQEKEMSRVVNEAIYSAKIENENKLRNSYNVENSIIDKLLGRTKYRKLMIENHTLKAELLEKDYNEKPVEMKSIFELVNMIENTEIKTGGLLYLQDEMIKAFMIDRNVIKQNQNDSWKIINLMPSGFFAQRSYYKILNENLIKENAEIKRKLQDSVVVKIEERNTTKEKLLRLNAKLAKILKEKAILDT